MKQLIIILCIYSIAYTANGQTQISKTIPANKLTSTNLNFEYADVLIKTWDKPEIKISGTVTINMGKNDDAFDIEIKEKNGQVSIKTSVDAESLPKSVWGKRGGQSIIINEDEVDDYTCINYGSHIENTFTIMIPSNLTLESKSTYGSTTVEGFTKNIKIINTYGSIDASTKSINSENTIEFRSTYASVDLSIPQTAKADLELKTDYGQIYSDLDMQINIKRNVTKKIFGDKINSKLNGGGNKIILESNYSNIYIRES